MAREGGREILTGERERERESTSRGEGPRVSWEERRISREPRETDRSDRKNLIFIELLVMQGYFIAKYYY